MVSVYRCIGLVRNLNSFRHYNCTTSLSSAYKLKLGCQPFTSPCRERLTSTRQCRLIVNAVLFSSLSFCLSSYLSFTCTNSLNHSRLVM